MKYIHIDTYHIIMKKKEKKKFSRVYSAWIIKSNKEVEAEKEEKIKVQ